MQNFTQLKALHLSQNDKKESKRILEKYCHILLCHTNETRESVITIVALSKKLNLPLLDYAVSTYHRRLVQTNNALSPMQFVDELLFMQALLQHQHASIHRAFRNILTSHKAIAAVSNVGGPGIYQIDDNLQEYIAICNQINRSILTTVTADTNAYASYPVQIDVWIIPENVTKVSSCDVADDQEQKTEGSAIEELWHKFFCPKKKQQMSEYGYKYKLQILKKLTVNMQHGIIDNFESFSMDRKPASYLKIIGDFVASKLRALHPYHRYILLIDRRRENSDINVYFYQAPRGFDSITRGHSAYLRFLWNSRKCVLQAPRGFDGITRGHSAYLRFLWNSRKCVLPKDPTAYQAHDIGLLHCTNGYMFALSYCLWARNEISTYWWRHGAMMRFCTSDMKNLWPTFFAVHKRFKYHVHTEEPFCELPDEPFAQFYREASGRNDLYTLSCSDGISHQSNGCDVGGQEGIQQGNQNWSPRQQIIEKIETLRSIWPMAVESCIHHIEQQFDADECDVIDIIDDIAPEIQDSELLSYLVQHQVAEHDAIVFGQNLIQILNEGQELKVDC
eukprot:CAMPEP_0202730140 /NCGR_PEP_ID=MMETSP1385-20130828/186488_1 /ASSEMBLY_ACC=CAM_ASM_000861 /TAXON_ID=933848 /ORGANISM="Elphidium margaritaceum" /LENGTH=561 /DNA_ID=CAMNT_0049396413 /DNA_START=1 /DNA_END=1686 /DNA_ORIENTATION=+